jgi:tetratricopeptide (TPR) repeat protein
MTVKRYLGWVAVILLASKAPAWAHDRKESDDPLRDAAAALESRNYEQAIAKYTQGIAQIYCARGCAYAAKGDCDKAVADFTEAIRLEPQDAMAYYCRGNVYEKKGDHEKAIVDYTQAIRLDPQFIGAYVNRANAYESVGEYQKAVADHKQAIRIDPESWIPYHNLGWLLATCPKDEVRDGKKALELAKKACELDGWKDPWRLDTLAAAYAETGDFKEATKWVKEAVELGKDLPKERVEELRERLKLYQDGKPYRQKAPAGQR